MAFLLLKNVFWGVAKLIGSAATEAGMWKPHINHKRFFELLDEFAC